MPRDDPARTAQPNPGLALVTGCAGFIGSHLTDALLEDGHTVRGVDSFNDNYSYTLKMRNLRGALNHEGFDFRRCDLASVDDVAALLDDVDVVFHLAGEPGVRASWGDRFPSYVNNNIIATQALLESARHGNRPTIVYASSSSVYGFAETYPTREDQLPRPHSPYGVTKLTGEQLALTYEANFAVPVTCLRFFSVYGPRQRPDMAFTRFCAAGLSDSPIQLYGDGSQVRDFTYVSDIVDAVRAASHRAPALGKVLNIGGGSAVALKDAIVELEDVMGLRFDVQRSERVAGDVVQTGSDNTLAREHLSYEPKVALREGLSAQAAWMVELLDEVPLESIA